jgi:peptidoglycan/LPS O-acetylase OafA/YrhL
MDKNLMIKYRADIDGLRAISVLSVLIYHAKFYINGSTILTGGFLGVDIFFVISGYLISSLIFKEFEINNYFNFKKFYNRRIRRIIPVLMFITLSSIPIAYIFLLPYNLIEFSNSIFYSTFFLSNIFFILDGLQYGTNLSISKPFLHTWSLSVEEQFYVFFPLLTLFFLKFIKKYILELFIAILIMSLLVAEWQSNQNQLSNFYLLSSRIWELFAGVIVAFLHNKNISLIKKRHFLEIITLFSFLLIISSFIFFNNELKHPSLLTLIPVLSTSLIIYVNTDKTLLYKFLSLKIFVYIGLISYSLYLWHFPILSFMHLLGFNGNFFSFIGLIISLPLSIITYHFVEKRFRNLSLINNKFCYFSLSLSILIICIFTLFTHKTDGFIDRSKILFKNDMAQKPWEILKNSNNEMCHLKINNFCNFNYENSTGNIFLVGDSHMITLGKSLYDYSYQKKINFTSMTNGGCYFFPDFDYINLKTKNVGFGCDKKYQLKRVKNILSKDNSIIILGGNLNRYLSNTNLNGVSSDFIFDNSNISFNESFRRNLNLILENNKVILVYPIPEIPFNPLNKIFESSNSLNYQDLKNHIKTNKLKTPLDKYFIRSKNSFDFLDSFNHKNLFKVFPHKSFCDNTNCFVHNSDRLFYFDSEHLSVSGASILADLIIKKIEEIRF